MKKKKDFEGDFRKEEGVWQSKENFIFCHQIEKQ